MNTIPPKTIVLHWNEGRSAWAELPWFDWVRFRGFGKGQSSLLVGAEAGEHYFLVCKLGVHDELWDVIPHRYVVSADARLVHGFDGLDARERAESDRIAELDSTTAEEIERYNELVERGFSANLPPHHTLQKLVQAMPGIAGAQPGADCWNFLAAIGVCRSNIRPC